MQKTRVNAVVLLLVLAVAYTVFSSQPTELPQGLGQVWQLTYLKAAPGQRDRLERFITLNWFGPDDRARQKDYIDGFLLLRGAPADTTWDFLVIDIFADSTAHSLARERYRTEIMPEHKKQLIDGRDFPELGRIVGERTTRAISGHVEAVRLGL